MSTALTYLLMTVISFFLPDAANISTFLAAGICASTVSYAVGHLVVRYYKIIEYQHNELKILNTRILNELLFAYNIQRSLLPSPPHWNGIDLVTFNKPAREVGGDFYSFYSAENNRFILGLGDVSGKGVSAALLMAATLSSFDLVLSQQYLDPSNFLVRLDEILTPYTKSHRQNCALCYVEYYDDILRLANAGGIPPYIRRAKGGVDWPEAGGFPLGQGLGKEGYQEFPISLSEGDLVILTSDGVVESKNEAGELFGFERLKQTVAEAPGGNAQSMLDYLLTELFAFTDKHNLHDDITIVIFQVTNKLAFT